MTPATPTQAVKDYMAASRKLRKELSSPAKARAFLVKIGVAERTRSGTKPIRLAKRFRSS